jgi:hypothetical protein
VAIDNYAIVHQGVSAHCITPAYSLLPLTYYGIFWIDLCINMNNHQNAIFHQLDNFMKHSHSFAMTIFHKITNSAKLVTLLIIPTYCIFMAIISQ